MELIQPSSVLMPFVKGYFVVNFEQDMNADVFYPSGFIDIAVNISDGRLTTIIGGRSIDMPRIEVLGHLTLPTRLQVAKGTSLLVARIFPYANSLFFPNPIVELRNESIDLSTILSSEAITLSNKLDCAKTIGQKVDILNCFFTERLSINQELLKKAKMIAEMCQTLCRESVFDLHLLAEKFRMSDRYIQKLFEFTVGLTPRGFYNTNRFNKSAERIRHTDEQLTSVAYSCGYFDQAHLIKEFKTFTGITPSAARRNSILKMQEQNDKISN